MRHAYLAPAAVLLLSIVGLPLIISMAGGIPRLPEIFSDPSVWPATRNTLGFAAVSVPIEIGLGLMFALTLQESFRLRGLARAVALIPWALPTAVMAMSWRWIFNDTYGLANDLLVRLGLAREGIAWLGRPGTAFAAVVVADVWKTTPFVALILLAGLQSIPKDLYEASNLDGAGPLQRFRWITLPLLRPAIALALTFRLIQALGIFDLVQVMTEGGPADSTKTVALYIYKVLISYDMRDYGAALTLAAAAGAFGVTALLVRIVRGRMPA